MTLLSVGNAGVDFGASEIFRDITFTIAAGDRWAIVGRNGTGKTTLVKLITGDLAPTRGNVARQPGLRIALMDQHRRFPDDMSLWDIVAGAFGELVELEHSLARQAANLEHDHGDAAMAKYGRDLERFEREGGYQMSASVDSVLMGVGFDPVAARTTVIGTLSGGERGRVALARQLATPSDLLLLDEPTNHLDLDTTAWLEDYLRTTERTVVCISHDRAFLAAMADHVLHFEGGTAFAYTGGYQAFIAQREEKRLTQQRQFDKQQSKIASEETYIARNLAGQNTKQAKGRRKLLARMPRLSAPIGEDGVMALRLAAGARSGDRVVETEKVTIAVESRALIRDLTVVLERGETVALLGPNGAGKSTLIKTLIGEREPATGRVKIGPSTTVAYYRQDLAHLPLDATIYSVIEKQRPLWERRQVQGHLGKFGYSGDEVQRTVGTLSGGERARVALALLTLEQSNLLILDEPTNHLDVESIEAMEDAIESYEGSVLIVSHDRAVLRGVATQVWEIRDEKIDAFDGSFLEWEDVRADRKAKAERDARETAAKESERLAKARAKTNADNRAAERNAKSTGTPSSNGSANGAGKGKPASDGDTKRALRLAQKTLSDAELRVAVLEGKITELTSALEAPTLYDTPGGVAKAQQLGKALDEARDQLDEAVHDWSAAAERVQAVQPVSGR
ncbi:MAG TPA: ABC-F family ATP-binding cassette domain-containing protein [Gemmatimonas sp.]|nr:ABC-F family ATP-binding cassette domain-containing protein [Gemmatimonas sp.]